MIFLANLVTINKSKFVSIIFLRQAFQYFIFMKTRLISIESQPKKIVFVVVHVVAVVISVVDTRNIPNKNWLKPGY